MSAAHCFGEPNAETNEINDYQRYQIVTNLRSRSNSNYDLFSLSKIAGEVNLQTFNYSRLLKSLRNPLVDQLGLVYSVTKRLLFAFSSCAFYYIFLPERINIHPSYNRNTKKFDAAMIKLQHQIPFSHPAFYDKVLPVCVETSELQTGNLFDVCYQKYNPTYLTNFCESVGQKSKLIKSCR